MLTDRSYTLSERKTKDDILDVPKIKYRKMCRKTTTTKKAVQNMHKRGMNEK